MAIFLSSYDPDIIEAALGHPTKHAIYRDHKRLSDCDQCVQLIEDWADLVDHFSWRQRPGNPGERLGIY